MLERLFKRTETGTNKMRIPAKVVKKFGQDYYMEIYKDRIVLIPVKEVK